MEYKVISTIDNQPTFNVPLSDILKECKPGGALKVLSPLEYITDQQRKWWKGVLLKELAKDSGDSVEYWETKLKLAVLPDEFAPVYVAHGKQVLSIIPSVKKLSKKKMNELIEGSVAKCREYGFEWATLPDEAKRKCPPKHSSAASPAADRESPRYSEK